MSNFEITFSSKLFISKYTFLDLDTAFSKGVNVLYGPILKKPAGCLQGIPKHKHDKLCDYLTFGQKGRAQEVIGGKSLLDALEIRGSNPTFVTQS